mmetsp:Transcript_6194/g.24123  ORF Transcript_6194/g.24123 Transcript_6194/m.24123 type:complete len:221 (+) Transcript_6194:321-983(+)
MESFILNVRMLVPQQVHDVLEVLLVPDVADHHLVVLAIQQDLAQQLDRLPLGRVVLTAQEAIVSLEHLVVLLVQEFGGGVLVLREHEPQGRERIRAQREVLPVHQRVEERPHTLVVVQHEPQQMGLPNGLPEAEIHVSAPSLRREATSLLLLMRTSAWFRTGSRAPANRSLGSAGRGRPRSRPGRCRSRPWASARSCRTGPTCISALRTAGCRSRPAGDA